jgi:seryl-tRNA(Sec) selenium transferase
LTSKKLDQYCERIVGPLKSGGKAALPPFQEALKVINTIGHVSRDRLKRQTYTLEIIEYLKSRNASPSED